MTEVMLKSRKMKYNFCCPRNSCVSSVNIRGLQIWCIKPAASCPVDYCFSYSVTFYLIDNMEFRILTYNSTCNTMVYFKNICGKCLFWMFVFCLFLFFKELIFRNSETCPVIQALNSLIGIHIVCLLPSFENRLRENMSILDWKKVIL